MEPARGGGIGDGFSDGHGEGDDIVLYARFELVDPGDVDLGAGADGGCGVSGHLARFGEGFRGGQFDVEPTGELVRVAPDAAYFFAGVTWNQFRFLV